MSHRSPSQRATQADPLALGPFVQDRDLQSDSSRLHPSVTLCDQLVRAADTRGSDVRLDSGELMHPHSWPRRPVDVARWTWRLCVRYKWKHKSHITELEARAILSALKWRLRSARHLRTRFIHLSDSQADLGVFTKGRSSSRKLHHVVKKAGCLVIAAFARPAYTETDVNPADAGSRLDKKRCCRR